MLLALVISIYLIMKNMGLDFGGLMETVFKSDYSRMIVTEIDSKRNFLKQILSGAFIAIVMTGLDQEMMQKNLSCRSLKDAQKNMFSFSVVLVLVNFIFLLLGASLFLFSTYNNLSLRIYNN